MNQISIIGKQIFFVTDANAEKPVMHVTLPSLVFGFIILLYIASIIAVYRNNWHHLPSKSDSPSLSNENSGKDDIEQTGDIEEVKINTE